MNSNIAGIVGAQADTVHKARSVSTVNTADAEKARQTEQSQASVRIELSREGRIKSAYAELQDSAQTLTEPRKTASASEVRKAAKALVAAYNKTIQGNPQNVATDQSGTSTRLPESAPSPAIRQDGIAAIGSQTLNTVGIAQQADGTLRLDEQALARNLESTPEPTRGTLDRIGRALESAASRELAPTDNDRPGLRATPAQIRQDAVEQARQQERVDDSRRNEARVAEQVTTTIAGGLAAYRRMFPA